MTPLELPAILFNVRTYLWCDDDDDDDDDDDCNWVRDLTVPMHLGLN
jgi:hypothetical protein